MSDYVVAIPSYNREKEIVSKTLTTLLNGGVTKNKIYIFVANKEQEKKYIDAVPKTHYHKIVVGKIGIANQRVFISNYFPVNKYIVSLDDDVEELQKLSGNSACSRRLKRAGAPLGFEKNNLLGSKAKSTRKRASGIKSSIKHGAGARGQSLHKLVKLKDLDGFFKDAYKVLKREHLYIWGVYPVRNAFFMYNKITTDLKFIIGVTFGYINRKLKDLIPTAEGKEDIEQSILYYKKDGGVVRFNNVVPKTKFNAPGGLGTDRFDMNKKAAEYLKKTYPDIITIFHRKNGMTEVKLARMPRIE